MATYVKTVKDVNGNTIYPQTKTSAVYDNNNINLQTVLDGKASLSGNNTFTGTITMGADPTNNMEVATKKYVDEHGSNVEVMTDEDVVEMFLTPNPMMMYDNLYITPRLSEQRVWDLY